ncbi:3-hydroxyacyl-ACP dehydratase FabZ [Marinihelvus fidelis]|uniref:3-hydroxyacyl-[acyl-carrier-protein] dehydratase FabZ n=1 Tax=Marinihelvus fidelis TaxID=2613842 RepID=A0A5N0T413_9GAMM|nr:3-hydroxyacyl-ACP dehydratase FabZ [Marinihelvus fidelis]KAA9129601.1 3-hydroxyacyl-ACP dehydratase FabZ [Marinihelvus fidelis]
MTDSSTEITLPGQVIDIEQIQTLIPHRYPFLLVDRVLSWQLEPDKRLRAIKNVTQNEPHFTGHFPTHPVMPGVLIVEAMAQAAGVLGAIAQAAENKETPLFYLVKVDNARFSQPVVPGDQLVMDVLEKRRMRNMGQYYCEAAVDGKKVASCELLCAGK